MSGNPATLVLDLQETEIWLVEGVFHRSSRNFDLLHQLLVVRINRIKPVNHLVLVHMRSGITQGTERVHGIKRCFASTGETTIHTLRFINNQNGSHRLDKVNWLFPAGRLISSLTVNIIDILFVDGTNRHHHNLDLRAGSKITHLPQLRGVIEEIFKRHASIEPLKMLFGNLKGFVNPLLDCH